MKILENNSCDQGEACYTNNMENGLKKGEQKMLVRVDPKSRKVLFDKMTGLPYIKTVGEVLQEKINNPDSRAVYEELSAHFDIEEIEVFAV